MNGLFRTQLEDGIMGMDNRKGAFWLQLLDHYKSNGYDESTRDTSSFDPAQFSLCYDHQPMSQDLVPGVGAGALTLGGTDPLLHNTDMVYAENITPHAGWYTVRIKAMFLRTKGGTLSEPYAAAGDDASAAVKYIRVEAQEDAMNGQSDKGKGVIVDSGTTDTYLPQALKDAFDEAWRSAPATNGVSYHNNPVQLTPDEVQSLPTILLVLQGHAGSVENSNDDAVGIAKSHEQMLEGQNKDAVSPSDIVVAIPPTHYMEASRTYPGKYTARVYFTERMGAQSILGSNVLMGHEVNFDISQGRIGFSESHCDYSRYIKERDAVLQQQGEKKGEKAEEEPVSRVAKTHNADGANELTASGWTRI